MGDPNTTAKKVCRSNAPSAAGSCCDAIGPKFFRSVGPTAALPQPLAGARYMLAGGMRDSDLAWMKPSAKTITTSETPKVVAVEVAASRGSKAMFTAIWNSQLHTVATPAHTRPPRQLSPRDRKRRRGGLPSALPRTPTVKSSAVMSQLSGP